MNRTASSFLLLAAGAMLLAGCATIGGSRADKAAAAAPPPPLPSASKSIAAGDAMSRAGDLDGALAEYVRALTVDPKSVDAYFRIAQTHETLGDLDIAAGAYRKVLALNPEHSRAIEGLGLIFLRQKKLADARTTLTFAVQKNASLWAAHNGLGVIADLSGNSTLADGEYRKALALKPDSPEVLNNFGYSRYLVGQLKEAQAYFQRALAIDPASGKAWSNLGLIYARQGDYVRSVSAFRELMPEPQAYYSAGYVCMLAHKYADARELFHRAIDASPSYYGAAHDSLVRAEQEAANAPDVLVPVSAAPAAVAPKVVAAAARPRKAAAPVAQKVAIASPGAGADDAPLNGAFR